MQRLLVLSNWRGVAIGNIRAVAGIALLIHLRPAIIVPEQLLQKLNIQRLLHDVIHAIVKALLFNVYSAKTEG